MLILLTFISILCSTQRKRKGISWPSGLEKNCSQFLISQKDERIAISMKVIILSGT